MGMPGSDMGEPKKNTILDKGMLAFIGFSGLLVFLLPEDILGRYQGLQHLVNFMGGWFPLMEGLGKHVSIPQVAQVTYAIQLICFPFLVFFVWIYMPKDLLNPSRMKGLLGAAFFLLMIVMVFWFMPAEPDLNNMTGRVSRLLLYSKTGFFLVSSVTILFASLAVVLGFIWLKVFLKIR